VSGFCKEAPKSGFTTPWGTKERGGARMRKLRMRKLIVSGFLLMLVFSATASPAGEKKIILVKGFAYPPYHMTTQKGQEGLFIEILEAAASMLNMEIEYRLRP